MVVLSAKRGEVTFVYNQKSEAKAVYLAGTFNDWSPDKKRMTRSKDGSFRARMKLAPGKYEYKFIVDGEWQADTDTATVQNEHGTANNVVEVG
jgi:1,4-alpha-glucan branching enzyme